MTVQEKRTRIQDEIIVDAYDDDEIVTSWFTFFCDELSFPFEIETPLKNKRGGKKMTKLEVLDVNIENTKSGISELLFEVCLENSDTILEIGASSLKKVSCSDKEIEDIFELWTYWNSGY